MKLQLNTVFLTELSSQNLEISFYDLHEDEIDIFQSNPSENIQVLILNLPESN